MASKSIIFVIKTTIKIQIMTSKRVFFLLASLALLSCEKYDALDAPGESLEASSTLVVRARSSAGAASDGSVVSYPVGVYVFESGGSCVETATIDSPESSISARLPEGSYDVYAIGGADPERYVLPSRETASRESVIALRGGSAHGDLMSGHSSVRLSYGEENTLTLSMSRKVFLLESVTIGGVPSSVTAVSVSVSPLYGDLLLDGGYSDAKDDSFTLGLSRDADGSTWSDERGWYLLEASGPATIKVSMTTAGGTRSYSYTSGSELKANHKVSVSGTYTEQGVSLTGTITGASWEDPISIVFSFDESGSESGGVGDPSPGVSGDSGDEAVGGDAPEAGTLYEGCYVLRTEKAGGETLVTLMSTGEVSSLKFEKGDQASLKVAVDEALRGLAVDGISNWRLPSLEELEYVKENVESINENLEGHGENAFRIEQGNTVYSYYFMNDSGNICTYNPYRGDTNANPNSGASYLLLRAFATVRFGK